LNTAKKGELNHEFLFYIVIKKRDQKLPVYPKLLKPMAGAVFAVMLLLF